MKKKYKLIKDYPGCIFKIGDHLNVTFSTTRIHPENYPEFWEEIIEKDYEILSFRVKSFHENIRVLNKDGLYEFQGQGFELIKLINNNSYEIYSVKRLSDGEIFTIDDIISNEGEIINEFEIINDKLKVWFVHPSYSCPSKPKNNGSITGCGNMSFNWLNTIKKVKTPLFTTEDGVDIFEGDKYSYVNYLLSGFYNITSHSNHALKDGMKFFSTKEKALEYIALHKLLLSMNDIEILIAQCRQKGINFKSCEKEIEFRHELKELVKTKLNK